MAFISQKGRFWLDVCVRGRLKIGSDCFHREREVPGAPLDVICSA